MMTSGLILETVKFEMPAVTLNTVQVV